METEDASCETLMGHVLHVFPAFGLGGVPIRIANIINALGPSLRHTIISLDRCYDSRSRLRSDLQVEFLEVDPSKPGVAIAVARSYQVLKNQNPDLVITYNWGAIEWAMAAGLTLRCPLVHCESGFGPEEADGQIQRRVLFRRLALARARHVVVPSQTLLDIALNLWKLDARKLLHIPNGVDFERFARRPDPQVCSEIGLDRFAGHLLVGTAAPLRPEKNLSRLLHAFACLPTDAEARLVILGDGQERGTLTTLAQDLGISNRVLFAGHTENVESILGAFDLFVMSSDTEQMPNSLIQAMAAGLPVVATDVGDVRAVLSEDNREFVRPPQGHDKLSASISTLLGDRSLRQRLGAANRAHVERHYRQEQMFDRYRDLFARMLIGSA